MKETLDAASRSELIKYRFNRAAETIEEAEYNAKGGYYNAAVNRLFQARQAGDYEDFIYCDEDMFTEYKPQVEEFISALRELVDTKF